MTTTVLIHEFVTGGGLAGEPLPPSWAAEGLAMRRALAEDFSAIGGLRVTATLDARLRDDPGPWSTIRVRPGEEPDLMQAIPADYDYTLCVAPETGGVLEDRARWIARAGGRSLGSSPEAVALCADKIRTADFLRSRGLDAPDGLRVCPREGLPREAPYPAVLKPIDGAGSLMTFVLESPDDLPPESLAMGEALLQPYRPGSPMSAAYLLGPESWPILVGLSDQRIDRRDGRLTYAGGVTPSRFGAVTKPGPLIESVRSIPGLLGWVGVDFLRDEATGSITVLEINPRVTTSYVGFRRLARPEARPSPWITRIWLGMMGGLPSPFTPRTPPAPVAFSADGAIGPGVADR